VGAHSCNLADFTASGAKLQKLNKPTLNTLSTLIAVVFAAILGVILAPFWSELSTAIKPAIGAPAAALIGILILVGTAAFSLAILHYFAVLGAGTEAAATPEREGYDALRRQLASSTSVTSAYAHNLDGFLGGIDRFFCDQRSADQSLFSRIFGLRKPAPLWTAPAFDRCLLLALFYFVAAVALIWTASNQVGPAEAVLGLHAADDWRRAAILAAVGLSPLATWGALRVNRDLFSLASICIFAGATVVLGTSAFTVGYAVLGAIAGAIVVGIIGTFCGGGILTTIGAAIGAGAGAGAAAAAGAGGVAGAVASAVGFTFFFLDTDDIWDFFAGVFAFAVIGAAALVGAAAFAFVGTFSGTAARVGSVAVIGIAVYTIVFCVVGVYENSTGRGRQGIFLSVFIFVIVLACLAAAALLAHRDNWPTFGPAVLFVGLLAPVNALFDWMSVGLTRALMRRGIERETWWPYLYAVINALLALAVVAILAMAMVAAAQLFDDLAVHGGGNPVLPPMRELLGAIKAAPGKPEYWWIYATLFSAMLPSLINLFVAGVSLARGVPGVSTWLLGKVRQGEAVRAFDRLIVAIVLSLQGIVGLAIALVAQGFLCWAMLWQALPRLGIGVLDLASLVAH
jgi:hypothetical protein